MKYTTKTSIPVSTATKSIMRELGSDTDSASETEADRALLPSVWPDTAGGHQGVNINNLSNVFYFLGWSYMNMQSQINNDPWFPILANIQLCFPSSAHLIHSEHLAICPQNSSLAQNP